MTKQTDDEDYFLSEISRQLSQKLLEDFKKREEVRNCIPDLS